MNNTVSKLVATSVFAAALTTGVYADDTPTTLAEWQSEATNEITQNMRYPSVAARSGKEGNSTFHVTIDRYGNVMDVSTEEETGYSALDRASLRTLEKAEFPSIPANFSGDTLTFEVALNYKKTSTELRDDYLARRGAQVTGSRIAIIEVRDND